jgi:predicted ATPase/DNA-binding CsgD family transcriptional regulator
VMIVLMATRPSRFDLRSGSGLDSLPVPLSSLVGRARELERIGETLRRTRLVTLTGPGGVGKTRLALALAEREVGRRSAGVWLVDLVQGVDRIEVAREVARVLAVAVRRGTTATEALQRYLLDRDPLLVLDNCEHVVDACAELAGELLSSCASVRILATSRELLGVSGETVWRVEPLEAGDAYRLFVERARQRLPEFVPSDEDDAVIAGLCERLDRLPLAIELAAARVGVMSPAEILSSIELHAGELGGLGRRSAPRHRTVRAAVEWSYRLLDPVEQRAFRRLAVFVGGFDADAVSSVVPEFSLELLARLVDKSLLVVSENSRGKSRYRLLETMREYAHQLLLAASELETARERHFRHFAALADVALEEWLQTGKQWFVNQLDDDYENVRAALEYAAGADSCAGVRMLGGTRDLFYKFGQDEGFRLAERLLERCPTRDRYRVIALIAAGQLANATANLAHARTALAQARELSVALEEPVLEAWAAWFQGLTESLSGQLEAARQHLERSRALHHQLGVRIGEARALAGLGGSRLWAGDLETSRELHDAALSIYLEEGDRWGQGQCHVFLGMIAEESGTDTRATSQYRNAVELLRPFNDASLLPVALLGQASVLVARDPATALKVLAAASAIRDRVGGQFQPPFRPRADRVYATAVAKLAPDVERLWAEGSRLDLDDAVALAFGLRKPRAAGPGGLSERELEIARLVAEGLANKAIAARLHLSVRTVEVHVRHVLGKLGLENRTQLATWTHKRTG